MKRYLSIVMVSLLSLFARADLPGQEEVYGPESVVVVANSAMEGSLEVATTYMRLRNIPNEHLIILETSTEERVGFETFRDTVRNPILKELISRNLINAIEGQKDDLGRETALLFDNDIRYIVLCYGVPTKFGANSVDDSVYLENFLTKSNDQVAGLLRQKQFTNKGASVDSELALLLVRNSPLSGFFPNPLFNNERYRMSADLFRVTRLDGPSPEAVIRMIHNTIEGEKRGLRGRAYVDEDGRGGPYAVGNQWLKETAQLFEGMGFDLGHDTRNSTFNIDDRFDAPILYAGWYNKSVDGPFLMPGFEFPPGAVAAHLHSYSANVLRSTDKGWVGPMVDRGVSATFGNVAEPYLRFTHHFNLFFSALAKGWNFADAAYYALPGLSWQGVAVGDPLYRPFAVGFEEQLLDLGNPANILEDQYVLMRKINLLKQEGKSKEALELAEKGMLEVPGPALALMKANLQIENNQKRQARRSLEFFSEMDIEDPMLWGVMADLADTLGEIGGAKAALEIYRKFDDGDVPRSVRVPYLKRGISIANKARATDLAIDWRARTIHDPKPEPSQN